MTFDELLQKHEIKPPPCWSGVGPGWFPLLETCFREMKAAGWNGETHQIKEKFGTLRFYVGAQNDAISSAIDRAEAKSAVTCEECGEEGKRMSQGGWIKTRCEAHRGI